MSFENLSDEHVPSSTEVFLDTSIHCSKLKGPDFVQRIDRVLSLFRWKSTSTYAKVEFGNVILTQAEYFLRKLAEFQSHDRLVDFIANVLPHHLHRQKVTWGFNLLKGMANNDRERTERTRLSLQRLMKLGLAFVEQLSDRPLVDGTQCYWACRGVQKKRDGQLVWKTPVCKVDKKRCAIDDFFKENEPHFRRIKDAIDALPPDDRTEQLQGFSEVIGKALKDPTVLLDYRSGCKKLADAIIAVDSMAYSSFFSQNVAESELLTAVFKQDFYYLPANFSRGVQIQFGVSREE